MRIRKRGQKGREKEGRLGREGRVAEGRGKEEERSLWEKKE